jgi:hypothetical protein
MWLTRTACPSTVTIRINYLVRLRFRSTPLHAAKSSRREDAASGFEERLEARRPVVVAPQHAGLERVGRLADGDGGDALRQLVCDGFRGDGDDRSIAQEQEVPIGVERLAAEPRLEAGVPADADQNVEKPRS